MNEEILRLLRENNTILKRILSHIEEEKSAKAQLNRKIEQFAIDVCANVFVDYMTITEKEELKNKFRYE